MTVSSMLCIVLQYNVNVWAAARAIALLLYSECDVQCQHDEYYLRTSQHSSVLPTHICTNNLCLSNSCRVRLLATQAVLLLALSQQTYKDILQLQIANL
jgi:hypothetical protein